MIKWSSATFTTVTSSIAMIAPRTTTPPIARTLRSSLSDVFVAAWAAGVGVVDCVKAFPHLAASCCHRLFPWREWAPDAGNSYFRRFLTTAAILRHDPSLTASPPVRYTLSTEEMGGAL